ncbi:hypothetical protein M409DRAFT_55048 [Zasmidium cellare ATCC 36951]|uniref:Uncharacterized protein n=1 Tax=Zasmidium cellare ATCC 36951 TaxID=1080233 RepID=A0A6A6CKE3_ZASCE|nr:uncharacterized protein M409DRAFT_55048 [Zasmidium cellare ATCC 36951]KAF2166179.1 hypothetical protein M409DRAFT_55048 [Zasmidium cellare ATCC 36951]
MKVTFAATSALLLSGFATAAPFTERRRQAMERRLSNRRSADQSRTGQPLAVNYTTLDDRIKIEKSKNAQYSSNWAGAVEISTSITQVEGTANFPEVSVPTGGNSNTEYGGSAWVGIDGDTCSTSILQTGVDWVIQGGQAQYAAWYEWLPEYSYNFDITVNPGDEIFMKVVANSKTSGTAYITNNSTGESVSHTFSGETALCEENAEWIVEDFETVDSSGNAELIPFAKFSTVTFEGASYVHGGTTSGISGASIMDIQQDGKVLTSCSTSGEDEVVS